MPMFLLNLDLNLEVKAEQTNDTWPEMNASCEICEYLLNFQTTSAEFSEYLPTETTETY